MYIHINIYIYIYINIYTYIYMCVCVCVCVCVFKKILIVKFYLAYLLLIALLLDDYTKYSF